jgi:hypothetical protein
MAGYYSSTPKGNRIHGDQRVGYFVKNKFNGVGSSYHGVGSCDHFSDIMDLKFKLE